MTIHYSDDTVTLHHGDALQILRTLPDASVDSVCTDPPYGLAELPTTTVTAALTAWLTGDREHVPDGRGFMGNDWDRFVPPPALWDECYRVLKPGGHLLAFAAPRTTDLMTLSIRLAGFDVRDSIGMLSWTFGNGFPKSLNVSEAVDRHRAARGSEAVDRVRAWLNARRLEAGLTLTQVNDSLGAASNGGGLASAWMTNPTSKGMPDWEQWQQLKALIGFGDDMDAEVQRIHGVAAGDDRPTIGTELRDNAPSGIVSVDNYTRTRVVRRITAASSDEADTWTGWGTALKPSHEPITVARKPLIGTVAANVTTHRTGGINIDACRIPAGQDYADKCASVVGLNSNRNGDAYGEWAGTRRDSTHAGGRWPTNLLLVHHPDCTNTCVENCHVAEMDRQSGTRAGMGSRRILQRGSTVGVGLGFKADVGAPEPAAAGYDDTGGASRFFPTFRYDAKAPASERPRVDGEAHATVKPLSLMRWLVQLVTPPGGTVLEPFAGSGTTIEACLVENFRCIAVEREAKYLPLIMARISKPITPTLFGEFLGGAA